MDTKLSAVQAAMAAGDWQRAIALAARFPRLGDEREAILDAHTAWTNPGFVRGLRKDPEALKAAGAAALRHKYDRRPAQMNPGETHATAPRG